MRGHLALLFFVPALLRGESSNSDGAKQWQLLVRAATHPTRAGWSSTRTCGSKDPDHAAQEPLGSGLRAHAPRARPPISRYSTSTW